MNSGKPRNFIKKTLMGSDPITAGSDPFRSTLVSVVIPFKDRFPLLIECLNSVQNQTYKHLELILIDDDSKESYERLLKTEYGDFLPITYLRNSIALGAGSSRQLGFEHSTGDYVLYLDSDDILHPEMIQNCVDYLEVRPDYGMCYVTSRIFKTLTDLEHGESLPVNRHSDQYIAAGIISFILTQGRIWDTSAVLWRRSVIEQFHPWVAHRWEDYAYDAQIETENIRIGFVGKTLCFWRKHEDSLTVTADSVYSVRTNLLLEISNYVQESGSMKDKPGLNRFLRRKIMDLLIRFEGLQEAAPSVIQDPFLRFSISKPIVHNRLALRVLRKVCV